jgi:hypothetical protein
LGGLAEDCIGLVCALFWHDYLDTANGDGVANERVDDVFVP